MKFDTYICFMQSVYVFIVMTTIKCNPDSVLSSSLSLRVINVSNSAPQMSVKNKVLH